MGRSPFFEYGVWLRAPPLQQDMEVWDLPVGTTIRIVSSVGRRSSLDSLIPMSVERCCSTYGMEEDYFPDTGTIYRITDKTVETYRRPFVTERDLPALARIMARLGLSPERLLALRLQFSFRMMSLDRPGVMTTWRLRSDGRVLNVEDYSCRGRVLSVQPAGDECCQDN
ncbi:hypothetical protein EBZ80_01140 [bacterium]|nr:hypothetical protein [bacterium]